MIFLGDHASNLRGISRFIHANQIQALSGGHEQKVVSISIRLIEKCLIYSYVSGGNDMHIIAGNRRPIAREKRKNKNC